MEAKKLESSRFSLNGLIKVPGDKSISHRSVMFGSLASGTTTVDNFLPGEDCLRTIACFRQLGVDIHQDGGRVTIEGSGFCGLVEPSGILNVGNSGTTIRLLMGILAGRPFHSVLIGDESIGKRPMTRVTRPLIEMGAKISGRKNGEFTPLSLDGGTLQGIEYKLPVASAQVKSAILLAGLQANGETRVIEPERTRDHTERMIRMFGGEVTTEGNVIYVNGGQQLQATHVNVPGDISSAAFFLVAATIVPDSKVELINVGLNPTRTGIIDVLAAMGADIKIHEYDHAQDEPAGDIVVKSSSLKGIEISGDLIPRLIDEIPIIALLATQAEGNTIIKDAAELKVKETNRIDTVVNELRKLGARIDATDDGMTIYGRSSQLTGGTVSSHGDHRIGMMLAVAALMCTDEVLLEQSDAVAVSYPNFFADLYALFD